MKHYYEIEYIEESKIAPAKDEYEMKVPMYPFGPNDFEPLTQELLDS